MTKWRPLVDIKTAEIAALRRRRRRGLIIDWCWRLVLGALVLMGAMSLGYWLRLMTP